MQVPVSLPSYEPLANHGILRLPEFKHGRHGARPGFSTGFPSLMGITCHNSKHWAVAKSMARIPSYAPDRIDHCDSVRKLAMQASGMLTSTWKSSSSLLFVAQTLSLGMTFIH